MRGLSALHTQPRPPLRCDKDKATEKLNARRVGNGTEGASRVMGTLARNSFHNREFQMHFSVIFLRWRLVTHVPKRHHFRIPLLLGGGAGKRQESGAAAGLAWAALLKDGASFFH
jgi:hypothetical protein